MELDASIQELLPYLAARLPGCNYVHGSDVIDLMDPGHIVGIYPKQITITSVGGEEEAERLFSEYFAKIRDADARKGTITPVYKTRSTLGVLDILRALLETNCGACSSPTCMAFAASVFRREADLSACPSFIESLGEQRGLIQAMGAKGYKVPEGCTASAPEG